MLSSIKLIKNCRIKLQFLFGYALFYNAIYTDQISAHLKKQFIAPIKATVQRYTNVVKLITDLSVP